MPQFDREGRGSKSVSDAIGDLPEVMESEIKKDDPPPLLTGLKRASSVATNYAGL